MTRLGYISLILIALIQFALARWTTRRQYREGFSHFPQWYRDDVHLGFRHRARWYEPENRESRFLWDEHFEARWSSETGYAGYVVGALFLATGILGLLGVI